MKILILMPRQLGDVILTTTFLKVLKKKYPDSEIHWWAHPLAAGVLDGQPDITKTHYWPVSKLRLRRLRFDLVIDAINYPKSAWLALLTGAKMRISFRTNTFRDKAYTHLVSRDAINQAGYLGHARLKLLEPLGISLSHQQLRTINPSIVLSESDYLKPKEWLDGESNFILISPTSRRANRIYPVEKITDVAVGLIHENNVSIIWTFGPGEEPFVKNVQNMMERKLLSQNLPVHKSRLSPLFSLKQAAALLSFAKGWIGNTNGMSHIAVAIGLKTLTLYGPSNPYSWAHPDFNKHLVVKIDKGCTGCNNNACHLIKQECFEDLDFTTVLTLAQNHFFQ